MKVLLSAIVITFALAAVAQQSSPQLPPTANPPISPAPDKDIGRQMPPDTLAKAPSSVEVRHQIQDKIDSEPGLSGARLKVVVTNSAVTLTGIVSDEKQHETTRRIVESYAGPRKIVDNVRVKPQKTKASDFGEPRPEN